MSNGNTNTELFARIAAIEEGRKEDVRRLDIHDKEIEQLKETNSILKNMDYRMEKMEKSVEKIDEKIDLKVKEDLGYKGKKWDKLIDYIFYAVLGILLSFIAVKLGLQ